MVQDVVHHLVHDVASFSCEYFNGLETEGPRVRASPASLRCGP